MACGFVHDRVQGDCACCGIAVLRIGQIITDIDYHRLHFNLENGDLLPTTLCSECVTHEWTPEYLLALTAQCIRGWQLHPGTTGYIPKDFKVTGVDPLPIQDWDGVNSISLR
jgi:hypothetical protein